MKMMMIAANSTCLMAIGLGLSIGLSAFLHASQIDTLVEDVSLMGEGGIEEARKSARAHAASSGEQLGYHSVGLEQLRFSGTYTLPQMPEGQEGGAYGMAIFSDDGCELRIDGEVVHTRLRVGQALPNLARSFHEVDVVLYPGQEIYVELHYSNVYFITRGNFADIDGATIYIYNKPVSLGLAVDANRDGDIRMGSEFTSQDAPYRFWINNDEDRREDSEDVESDVATNPDHADDRIRTQRDLEDFTRLQMAIGDYHDKLKSGEVKAVLKFKKDKLVGSPAITVWPHLDEGGSRDYLIEQESAKRHTRLKPLGRVSADSELEIPTAYWAGKAPFGDVSAIEQGASLRHLLYEGAGTGQGALVLELVEKGRSIGVSSPTWIRLMDVREMYQRAKVTPDHPDQIPEPTQVFGEADNPLVEVPEPAMGWTWDQNGKLFHSDPDETKDYLIFVHGWRMTYHGCQKYGETMFKRSWQAGYKGRFLFIRWPTYSEDTHRFTNGFLTYNIADYRAWKSGKAVAQIVNSLRAGYTKNICAHSMGNIVVGSAFREGMAVDKYALFNAAVPAMCYDDNKRLHKVHEPTPDDDKDPITKAMGYERKLAIMGQTKVTNFYLAGDEALAQWLNNNKYFKPNKLGPVEIRPKKFRLNVFGYRYYPAQEPGTKLQFRGLLMPDRHLRSFHEAAAYAVKSKTWAVGAEAEAAGQIDAKIDMNKDFRFGTTHSAQWLWRGQKTMPFFIQVLNTFNLKPTL